MAKAFSIRDLLGDDTQLQETEADVYEKVSVYDIESNPKNEYTMSEIEKIKDSIYALGGVQQNIVLIRCTKGAEHKYLALDGHRRLTASRELVEEGHNEFEFVPAVIKGQIDADIEDAMLIMMNSTQRNKTDWEKVMEHMRLKEIIPKLKKRQGLDGRTRDIELDLLGVSRGQISIYNTIGTRLSAELMELFKNGSIGISLAHEAAQLEPELQQKLMDIMLVKGSFTEEDIRQLVGSRPVEGQITIQTEDDENVPESGTFEEIQEAPISTSMEADKNVPESGTFREILNEQTEASALGVENVPESGTFEETREAPISTSMEADKNVPDSGTLRTDKPEKYEEHEGNLQRSYTLATVIHLIETYKDYLRMAKEEDHSNLVRQYSCLLDALDLLKKKLTEDENIFGDKE